MLRVELFPFSFVGLTHPAVRAIYEQVNPQLEKWCDFVIFFAINVLYPTAMLTIFTISYAIYFMADLGNEAFLMPFPYWYVTAKQQQHKFIEHAVNNILISIHLQIFQKVSI